MKKAFKKAKRKFIQPWKALSVLTSILLVIALLAGVIVNKADNTMAIITGDTYWELENEDESAVYYNCCNNGWHGQFEVHQFIFDKAHSCQGRSAGGGKFVGSNCLMHRQACNQISRKRNQSTAASNGIYKSR